MFTSVQTAIPVLIGTKYDAFAAFPKEEQEEITKQAKRFSKAMHAPLVSPIWPRDVLSCTERPDLLFNIAFHQCTKDLQDRAGQGFRAQGMSATFTLPH